MPNNKQVPKTSKQGRPVIVNPRSARMSDDDDNLDSFFTEINQIEEEQVVTADVSHTKAVVPVRPGLIVSQSKVVIASRPQVATSSSSSVDHCSKKEAVLSVAEKAELYNKLMEERDNIKNNSVAENSTIATNDVAMRTEKKFVRTGGGSVWVDETLRDWPENDYRLFIGDISKEVTDEAVTKHFKSLYKSFVKARVVHSKKESKGRGYAFVSFLDPLECAKALREQNGKYLCNRPMRLTRADWKENDVKEVRKKEQQKRKFGLM